MLAGEHGAAAQWAMSLLVALGKAAGARRMLDLEGAHLVGSYHSGPANLAVLRQLVGAGARVRIPTSLNASSADLRSECHQRYRGGATESAREVVGLYCQMGCRPLLSCAPYWIDDIRPKAGAVLAWAESNAVLFANSVIGAHCLKTPQYVDLAGALTGRMPDVDALAPDGRTPQWVADISAWPLAWREAPLAYELLGFFLGQTGGAQIPLLRGVPARIPEGPLRSLCAAAGVSGGFAVIQIEGVTPNIPGLPPGLPVQPIQATDLLAVWQRLGRAERGPVGAVCIGAPHASLEDIRALQQACNKVGAFRVPVHLSASRTILALAAEAGMIGGMEAKGVHFVADTCTYYGALLEGTRDLVLTTSAKWAAYGPGNLGVRARLSSLAECIEAAASGVFRSELPIGASD
jgi:predicted aconitase